jgi:hypothetical protein
VVHRSTTRRRLSAAALASALLLASGRPAFAQTPPPAAPRAAATSTILRGTVTANDTPVADAALVLTGNGLRVTATSDAKGAFAFGDIPVGTYDVAVTSSAGTASIHVLVPAAGAIVAIPVTTLRVIGRVNVTSHPPAQGSGTDLSISSTQLQHSPANGSLSEILVQLPGAARGANGVVHINGDHGDINYIVDGVQVPQELNRDIGSEFDPNDISSVEVLEGAYPAQYGERFASVVDILSRVGSGPPGYSASFRGGSYGYADDDLSGHIPIGKGSLVAALRAEATNRDLDPPDFDSPHDAGSNVNQFIRYATPVGGDFLNITASHSYQTYQIPNDTAAGEPATTDDNETQEDLFAALQFRHLFPGGGSVSFGPSYKKSRIRDFGDPTNDYTFGAASNPGGPADCANALAAGSTLANLVPNANVNYSNASCGFSLAADRTSVDIAGNVDFDLPIGRNDVKAGAYADASHVSKTYAVSLQPGNFLAPIFTPATPNAPYTVVDTAPNVGHLYAEYVQGTLHLGPDYVVDAGVRQDAFSIFSTQFQRGFGQTSPRIKLTRNFGTRNSAYVFYGRFFTPFSLENVSPASAFLLNLPIQQSIAAFDLKPQRDSDYEIGGHIGIGQGDLGLRVMQKNSTDLIDDTQVGVTNLHQDINYQQGRIATQTLYYQYGLARGGRFYASAAHTYSVNKGCETQLLAPCFGSGNDWTPADHDQRVDVTSGVVLNDRHEGYLSVDGEYGSGLSSSLNPTGGITCAGFAYTANTGGPCKRTPHITFDLEKGIGLGNGTLLVARIRNLLNDRYIITTANAQGLHYAQPRLFDIGLKFSK